MAVTATHLVNLGSATDASTYAVASFTLAANSLGLLSVANSHGTAATLPTITDANRTWTQVATVTWNGGLRRVTLFRSLNGSGTTGGATIDFGGTTQLGCDHSVDAFAGVDTSGINGAGAIVQSVTNSSASNTLSLTVTLAAFGHADNATYGTFCHEVSQVVSAGSGFSALANSNHSGPNTGYIAQWLATNDTSVDASWSPTTGKSGGIGAEIKAAASGSTAEIVATVPAATTAATATADSAADVSSVVASPSSSSAATADATAAVGSIAASPTTAATATASATAQIAGSLPAPTTTATTASAATAVLDGSIPAAITAITATTGSTAEAVIVALLPAATTAATATASATATIASVLPAAVALITATSPVAGATWRYFEADGLASSFDGVSSVSQSMEGVPG